MSLAVVRGGAGDETALLSEAVDRAGATVGVGGSVCDGSKDHGATTTCQNATAIGIAKVAKMLQPKFVLGLGDNFYQV